MLQKCLIMDKPNELSGNFGVCISEVYKLLHTFFYKNKLYRNTQAEIGLKIENKLRTLTRLKFWSDKFKKFI